MICLFRTIKSIVYSHEAWNRKKVILLLKVISIMGKIFLQLGFFFNLFLISHFLQFKLKTVLLQKCEFLIFVVLQWIKELRW